MTEEQKNILKIFKVQEAQEKIEEELALNQGRLTNGRIIQVGAWHIIYQVDF